MNTLSTFAKNYYYFFSFNLYFWAKACFGFAVSDKVTA